MPPRSVKYSSIVIRTSTIFIDSWSNLLQQFLMRSVLLLQLMRHSWLSDLPGVPLERVYDLLLQNILWYLHNLCHGLCKRSPTYRYNGLGSLLPAVCMSVRRCFDHLSSLGHTSDHEFEPSGSPSSRQYFGLNECSVCGCVSTSTVAPHSTFQ